MRIHEILNEQIISEGGDATSKRFFSELGALAAWAGKGDNLSFDPERPEDWLDASKIDDAETVFRDIKRFLPTARQKYDAAVKPPHFEIGEYYEISKRSRDLILSDMKQKGLPPPTKFGWVGGENALSVGATPSDVNFIDNPIAGVSIKDDGGVGVGNLGAGELEFEGKGDLFARLAPKELFALKEAVMIDLIEHLKEVGSVAAGSKQNYTMTWDEENGLIHIAAPGMKDVSGTPDNVTNWGFLQKSNEYQRCLGEYFLENGGKYTQFTGALLDATSDKILNAIEKKVIPNADKLAKLGGFGSQPYYYQLARPFKVGFVPDKSTANEIEIVKITPPKVMSGGLKYLIALQRPGADGTATVEVHIRYAQGIFASSPSFRIQSLKGHQNLYWEILTSKK